MLVPATACDSYCMGTVRQHVGRWHIGISATTESLQSSEMSHSRFCTWWAGMLKGLPQLRLQAEAFPTIWRTRKKVAFCCYIKLGHLEVCG